MVLNEGILTCRVEGEFELQLTLHSPVPEYDWTVLSVAVMVGPRATAAGGGEGGEVSLRIICIS